MEFICPVLALIGEYLAFGCGYRLTATFGGTIWGINVPMSAKQRAWKSKNKILFIAGIILFIMTCGPAFGGLLASLFSGFFGLIYAVACVAGFFVIAIISTKRAVKEIQEGSIAKDTNAAVLGELPIVKRVEEQLGDAISFVITGEGIGLIDSHNYCFASEMYSDYRLGNLSSANEVALLGMYFSQKYRDEFDYKVDFERTYHPGQTVTFIGTGGVYMGHTRSTPDSQFKSYIFYRKGNFKHS